MIEEAIKKIEEEISKNKNDEVLQIVGDYVLKNIEVNREGAKDIAEGKKSIKDAIKEMEKVAKAKAVNGCGALTDTEGFAIVRKYFNFEAVQDKILNLELADIKEEQKIEPLQTKNKQSIDFDVKLEDLF